MASRRSWVGIVRRRPPAVRAVASARTAGHVRYALAAVSALAFLGCGLLKARPAAPAPVPAPAPEIKVAAPKGDSAATVPAELDFLDSGATTGAAAGALYIQTLDNYLSALPGDEKAPEILTWKANQYYNTGEFAKAASVYEQVRTEYPASPQAAEASQMAAQAYAQQGKLDEAEKIYRSMMKAGDGATAAEARERLAQSIYLQAEKAEKEGRLEAASVLFQRIPREFPAAAIAPIALFNAGVMQEKQKKWKEAIRVYLLFCDAYYESDLLPKVLFREAKCREQDGQWKEAGDKYRNLSRAHPQSPEAEPSLYNAGFAYLNGKLSDSAAIAFEAYAERYPQKEESPNLLFRAVEIYGELKNWEKVSELQSLFTRRYASDKGRLIQALCMGGTAAFNRGRAEEAANLMARAVREFAGMRNPDAGSRFYAAQAQHTLGDIAAARMREAGIGGESRARDLKAKTALLKAAVDEYLKVLDYRIVDWALRAAHSLGRGFEDFGIQVYEGGRPSARSVDERLDQREEALASLSAAYARAQQQYLQVLAIARKQEINNRWTEEAEARLASMAKRYFDEQGKAMAEVPRFLRFDAATPEKAIAGKLQQIGRITPYLEQSLKYFEAFHAIAEEYDLPAATVDSMGGAILGGTLSLGRHYADAAGLARAAPIPGGFQSMERFFYQVKLIREGIPRLEDKAIGYFTQGLEFAAKYGLERDSVRDSLRTSLGKALFVQAKCLDLLAQEALTHPPLPPDAAPEQKKTYLEKIEEVGYELQDLAIRKYRGIVEALVAGRIPENWGEMAFARLYQIEPDQWSRAGDRDTTVEILTGPDWRVLPGLPPEGWPAEDADGWAKPRKGLMPAGPYPAPVISAPRFLWGGERGSGPKVDTAIAKYIPWRNLAAQVGFDLPAQARGLELLVVARPPWAILIDRDTVLAGREGEAGWEKGVAKDVWPKPAGKLAPGRHFLRILAENTDPTRGFGIWVRLGIRLRYGGAGPVFPWNQASPDPAYLKSLLEREIDIPNFGKPVGAAGQP